MLIYKCLFSVNCQSSYLNYIDKAPANLIDIKQRDISTNVSPLCLGYNMHLLFYNLVFFFSVHRERQLPGAPDEHLVHGRPVVPAPVVHDEAPICPSRPLVYSTNYHSLRVSAAF